MAEYKEDLIRLTRHRVSTTSNCLPSGATSQPADLLWRRAASRLTASPASRQNSTSWWGHSARRASVGFWISSKSRLSSLPTHSSRRGCSRLTSSLTTRRSTSCSRWSPLAPGALPSSSPRLAGSLPMQSGDEHLLHTPVPLPPPCRAPHHAG